MTLDGHSLLGPDQPGRTPSRLPRDESSRHGRYAAGAHVWPQSEPVTARRTVMRSPDPRPPLLKSGGGRLVFPIHSPHVHAGLACATPRHCEERGDEAIQFWIATRPAVRRDGSSIYQERAYSRGALAMTKKGKEPGKCQASLSALA